MYTNCFLLQSLQWLYHLLNNNPPSKNILKITFLKKKPKKPEILHNSYLWDFDNLFYTLALYFMLQICYKIIIQIKFLFKFSFSYKKNQALELRLWNSEFKLDLSFDKVLGTQIEELGATSLTVLDLFLHSITSKLLLCFDLWSHCLCLFLHRIYTLLDF